jgi:DNA-binding transcriptional LysR family regulator
MDNWDEIKTAYQVARRGTVSGAAEELGVHHATVIRHIDALEGKLGVKLFQRHARGYAATEAGEDLLRVAQATDDQFGQLEGRIKGRGAEVSGELVITSLSALGAVLTPVLADFQQAHPDLVVRFLTGDRLFRLEYGEAHVAVRAGPIPEEPDNVVQPLAIMPVGLFASKGYAAQHGLPTGIEDFGGHRFVGLDSLRTRAPFQMWLNDTISREQLVFRASDPKILEQAVLGGAGIGFLPRWMIQERNDLIEVIPPHENWQGPLWLVTHVDLHRTTKVQAFLSFLKERAQNWNTP